MQSKPVTNISTGPTHSARLGYLKSGKLLTFDSFWAKKLGISLEAMKLLSTLTIVMQPYQQKLEEFAAMPSNTNTTSCSPATMTPTLSPKGFAVLGSSITITSEDFVVLPVVTPPHIVQVSLTGFPEKQWTL